MTGWNASIFLGKGVANWFHPSIVFFCNSILRHGHLFSFLLSSITNYLSNALFIGEDPVVYNLFDLKLRPLPSIRAL
jgi:hypothetical protein